MEKHDRIRSTPGGTLRPLAEFPDVTQDVADVLYSLSDQDDQERFIDYAQRLVDALAESKLKIVRVPE